MPWWCSSCCGGRWPWCGGCCCAPGWVCAPWVLNQAGALIGVRVGVNLLGALVLGVLGAPGLGLLLMTQWVLR